MNFNRPTCIFRTTSFLCITDQHIHSVWQASLRNTTVFCVHPRQMLAVFALTTKDLNVLWSLPPAHVSPTSAHLKPSVQHIRFYFTACRSMRNFVAFLLCILLASDFNWSFSHRQSSVCAYKCLFPPRMLTQNKASWMLICMFYIFIVVRYWHGYI